MTARRAGLLIATVTVVVTIVSGVLMWVLDHDEFPNVWLGLWWAVQTVTTVGYGDVTPENPIGRAIAAIVMLSGIGFLTVVTAAITAVFVESARRKIRADDLTAQSDRHAEILEPSTASRRASARARASRRPRGRALPGRLHGRPLAPPGSG
jgi:voltage-gated potassium channel